MSHQTYQAVCIHLAIGVYTSYSSFIGFTENNSKTVYINFINGSNCKIQRRYFIVLELKLVCLCNKLSFVLFLNMTPLFINICIFDFKIRRKSLIFQSWRSSFGMAVILCLWRILRGAFQFPVKGDKTNIQWKEWDWIVFLSYSDYL